MPYVSTATVTDDWQHGRAKYRHWCPASEPYTSADVLRGYLGQGWMPGDRVAIQMYALGGQRHTAIYSFTLRRADVVIIMPVLANPAVLHVIETYHLNVRRLHSGRGIGVEFRVVTNPAHWFYDPSVGVSRKSEEKSAICLSS